MTIRWETTTEDLIPKISFISKEWYQDFPLLILAPPKNNPLKLFPWWYLNFLRQLQLPM